MIKKKQALMIGIFGGIGFYVLPIFIDALKSAASVFKWVGGFVMAAGVIYFVAGDVLTGSGSLGSSGGYNRDIRRKLKKGLIDEKEAFKLQQKAFENEILRGKQELALAKQKVELTKLKNQNKQKVDYGSILGGDNKSKKDSKLPDVLGNLGPLFGAGTTQKDPMSNVQDMVGSTKQEPINTREIVTQKKKSQKDYDDLRDLF